MPPSTTTAPPVNVWSLRIEKMAAARAATAPTPKITLPPHASQSSNLRPAAPENWPQVGKAAPSDGTTSTSQSQPSTPSRRSEKTKWVPIPPEELQAAADAALKSRNQSQSHSRNRSNHPRNTNTTSSPLNTVSALPHSRSQSGRTSAIPSVSHSRVQSRASSLQSSPRVSRSRRLPGDEITNPNAPVKPTDGSDPFASNYVPPPNINPNSNLNYPSVQANGFYYPPSTSAALQSPPLPSFHASTPAFYPQGTLNVNASSPPLHHLTPPPPMGSPLSPASPPTHPYAYPMPIYGPYDYTAPAPSFAHGLSPYAPWHAHEYPPPPPRHRLSGQQSPIYPPPHFARHDTPPQPISHSESAAVAPAFSAGTSRFRERAMVFGSINLDSQSPDALSVPLPLSSVPSGSSAVIGDAEGSAIAKAPTFSIGVDTTERASGSVPPRLRSRTKTSEAINGDETAGSSSSPRKTSTTAKDAVFFTSISVGEVKKWRFGTTSMEGANTPLVDRDVSLPSVEAGPSSLGLPDVAPAAVQLQHSATMPDVTAGGGSLMTPPPGPPLASEARGGSVAEPEPLEVDPSLAPVPTSLTGDGDSDLEVKDYGYGFGDASGSGYATLQAREERLARQQRHQREREWEMERIRMEREMLPLGWQDETPPYHHRSPFGSGSVHGEEALAGEIEALSLGASTPGRSIAEGEDAGPVLGREYPQHRGGPVEGMPPHPGRGRRGYGRGHPADRGTGERGERGRRGRGANGFGAGAGGRGHNSRGGPQQRPGPPPFSVTPPPPHFQPLPLLPHEQQQHYYPPPRQQHQGPHYLPPSSNGYDYSSAPLPQSHGVPVPPPHHHLPITPPLPPGLSGAAPGLGGVPLPPPQSTIPFPLDPTRYWLLGQLEYYLSPQNMAQDFFLRQRMDARGWIPIPLLASFNRVQLLTHDTQLVRDVLALSQLVQVRGSMVRMGGWERFVLPDAQPSTVEEQPLPLVYQAQNMGYWEEGGQGQGQGQAGFGAGEGYQQQVGPDGHPVWYDRPASTQGERSDAQQGQAQYSTVAAVNGHGHDATSPGASILAEAHDINGHGGVAVNGVYKHASEQDFEEEEEEDVVFVMGDEAVGGGSWSPDRRS